MENDESKVAQLNKRKTLTYTGISVLILAVLAVGGYYYALHYYSRQIDKFMDILLAEMLEENNLPQEKSEGSPVKDNAKPDKTQSDNEANKPEKVTDNKPEPTQDTHEKDETAEPDEPDPDKSEKEGTSSPPSKPEDTPDLEELEDRYTPAFRKVELRDQLFTLQMLRKFSASEIRELFRLYEKGGKSIGELFHMMEERIPPEEMERIMDVAKKYKGFI